MEMKLKDSRTYKFTMTFEDLTIIRIMDR